MLLVAAPAGAVTREEFVVQADAICDDALPSVNRKLTKARRAIRRTKELEPGLSLLNDGLRKFQRMLSRLEDLEPSDGDRRAIGNWLSYERDVAINLQLAVRQLRKGNELGANFSIARAEAKGDHAEDLGQELGLRECA